MNTTIVKTLFIFVCTAILGRLAFSQIPPGPYLGQPYPGSIPGLFAPGLLPGYTSDITFTPDGLECFSTRWYPGSGSILMTAREQSGNWTDFDTVSFSAEQDQCPHLTPDGNRLYFICYKPVPPSPYYARHLWYSDRVGSGWSPPALMGSPLFEHYIISVSASDSGNLYLGIADNNDPGIYISRIVNGTFTEPEKLGDSINYLHRPLRPHIATDESYLLFDVGESSDPLSQRDLAISHRKTDGTWSKAMLLNSTVNSNADEISRFVSRDNRFIFFGRDADNYWMDAANILTAQDETRKDCITPQLNQNFPNPFGSYTTLSFSLPEPEKITLTVCNLFSREIVILDNGMRPAGINEVKFCANDLPAGVYEYVLKTRNSIITRKMIHLK
jgi:hypothetical protein